VQLKDIINIAGPAGGLTRFAGNLYHPVLQTVRVPLSAFGSITTLKAVRFVFDDTKRAAIFLAIIPVSTAEAGGGAVTSAPATAVDTILDQGARQPDDNRG
jgi:hypothetical protein